MYFVFYQTQLTQAAPVNGGIGMFLLQKMGWKQGEGLGKNNEGSKEPLMLDIKIDRKGNCQILKSFLFMNFLLNKLLCTYNLSSPSNNKHIIYHPLPVVN